MAQQGGIKEIPYVEIHHVSAFLEQVAHRVRPMAGKQRESEGSRFILWRRRLEPVQPVVAQCHPLAVAGVQGVAVVSVRIKPLQIQDYDGVCSVVPNSFFRRLAGSCVFASFSINGTVLRKALNVDSAASPLNSETDVAARILREALKKLELTN